MSEPEDTHDNVPGSGLVEVISEMDPVSNLILLAPESREEWLAAYPKSPVEGLVAAS